MITRKTNVFLLITVIIGLVFDIWICHLPGLEANPWDLGKILEYLLIFVIGLSYLKACDMSFKEALPYHVPMKPEAVLWVFLMVFMVMPVTVLLSKLGGMIFGTSLDSLMNYVDQKELTIPQMILTRALIPAVFEEMIYRGFLYAGYRKGKGILISIFITAFLFGTFHMVAQQSVYAIFAGFVLALLRELTGSMWPGMFLHFLNNGSSVVRLTMEKYCPEYLKFLPSTHYTLDSRENVLMTLGIAIAGLIGLYFVFKRIAVIYGREDDFRRFFKEESAAENMAAEMTSDKESGISGAGDEALMDGAEKKKKKDILFSGALIAALVIQVLFMIFVEVITSLLDKLQL